MKQYLYFKHNSVPFSRVQYYRYCRTLQKRGEEGLRDKRKDGNYTKLTERIKDYIVSTVKENRSISSSHVQSKIINQFDAKISGFRSIDEKIQGKDFSAMNVFKMSEETISRYNLALLCLPLVTSNVKTSRVNRVKGNDSGDRWRR